MLRWAQYNFDKIPSAKKTQYTWCPKKMQNTIPNQTKQNSYHTEHKGKPFIDSPHKKTNKSISLPYISSHVHSISKTSVLQEIPLLVSVSEFPLKSKFTHNSFDEIVESYLEDHPACPYKSEMLKFLNLSKKRFQYAETKDISCSSICKKCLQFFANENKVQQHQTREKKHCTAAQFILKVISCYPKYKTYIQAMESGIQSLSAFDFLVYALSANPTCLPMVESKPTGISGQLVLAVAQQFHVMQPETILHFIGDIPVTYEDIHRILSGVTFDITDPTAVSLDQSTFI
jgi:hypothetical protein